MVLRIISGIVSQTGFYLSFCSSSLLNTFQMFLVLSPIIIDVFLLEMSAVVSQVFFLKFVVFIGDEVGFGIVVELSPLR